MRISDDFSKKYYVIFKKFLSFLWWFLCYLVCAPSFKSINSNSLSRKKYNGDSFTATPCIVLRGQNTSVGTGLIELTEPSDTLNYKLFFKHCYLQTILHAFLLLIFVWNKIFCSKNWAVFYNFLIWFGLTFGVVVLKALYFLFPFYNVIGNYGFINYSRYNLLGISIKTVL